MKKVLLLITALSLAGCAAQTYQDESAMRGAALGAGTGALIGGLAGGSVGSAVAGAAVGGAVGGVAGAAAAEPPPPRRGYPPEAVYVEEAEPCYVRTRSGRMRPVPCD